MPIGTGSTLIFSREVSLAIFPFTGIFTITCDHQCSSSIRKCSNKAGVNRGLYRAIYFEKVASQDTGIKKQRCENPIWDIEPVWVRTCPER